MEEVAFKLNIQYKDIKNFELKKRSREEQAAVCTMTGHDT